MIATVVAWVIVCAIILVCIWGMAAAMVILFHKTDVKENNVPRSRVHGQEEPQGVHVRIVPDDDPEG